MEATEAMEVAAETTDAVTETETATTKTTDAVTETETATTKTTGAVTETGTETAKTGTQAVIKLVYIGPSIPRSKLRNGQILSGTEAEIMEFIGGMSEEYAEIKYLLVEPKKLSDAQTKTQEKGNILHKYYQDMAAKARTSRRR